MGIICIEQSLVGRLTVKALEADIALHCGAESTIRSGVCRTSQNAPGLGVDFIPPHVHAHNPDGIAAE